ncbi:MAG TPA: hypothetical protein VMS86_13770 [Thermoanaerobaculia bacterium]|nr:hypothetical protein [Thermoanaerobaculia bacterium]
MRRRDFLRGGGALAASLLLDGGRTALGAVAGDADWDAGQVRHLLPAVSHDRFLLKLSLRARPASIPVLRVGEDQRVHGSMSDTRGLFWRFDAPGLEPMTSYQLELRDGRERLCDPWTLGTFPPLESQPSAFRLLVYTCAGGHEDARPPDGRTAFLPLAHRRRLLARALSFSPQAVVAIGDHVYWDLRAGPSAQLLAGSEIAARLDARSFRRDVAVLATENEPRLERVVSPQIADLYGTLLRSTPVFFVQDDHDYFENDHADEDIVTFPPDPFMLRLARATQQLYYPEFLPDPGRPTTLATTGATDRAAGVCESFGTLRYGRLVEALLWDCRRFVTLAGRSGVFLPADAEGWLRARMAVPASEMRHVVQVPSTPFGWSAGKWGEWYPDLLQDDGKLGTAKAKPYWQEGWRLQHDRLLEAAAAMDRKPLFVSGDLHALATGSIRRSGNLNLRSNPITTVLSGPLGTGEMGWPSAFRGIGATPPTGVEIDQSLRPLERNGFTLIDWTEDGVTLRLFSWKLGEDPAQIDTLEPFHTLEV